MLGKLLEWKCPIAPSFPTLLVLNHALSLQYEKHRKMICKKAWKHCKKFKIRKKHFATKIVCYLKSNIVNYNEPSFPLPSRPLKILTFLRTFKKELVLHCKLLFAVQFECFCHCWFHLWMFWLMLIGCGFNSCLKTTQT